MIEIETIFEDCVIEFKCPYCGQAWKADSKNGIEYCGCGMAYELKVVLEVTPPKKLK